MNNWNDASKKLLNRDPIYQDFFDKTGASSIEHIGLTFFGDPKDSNFLRKITILEHIYSVGDTLSKIAHKHYGNPKYWWLLAWYNSKPTDFHCKIGDIIIVPEPLGEVLIQAYNRITL